jgi:hypothetical protein
MGGEVVQPALLSIHNAMFPIILAAGGITLICGIVLIVLRNGVEAGSAAGALRLFRILLAITAGLGLLQDLVGGLLFLTGARPGEGLHFVYGAIVLLAIPVAYVYSDQKQVRRDIIIMTIAVVAVLGAAFRAWATGPLPH